MTSCQTKQRCCGAQGTRCRRQGIRTSGIPRNEVVITTKLRGSDMAAGQTRAGLDPHDAGERGIRDSDTHEEL